MRFSIVFACIVSVLLLAYVVATELIESPRAGEAPPDAADLASDVPIEVFTGDTARTTGPVTFFLRNCSRCHGPEDSAYRQIAQPRRGPALKTMIRQMAAGPAMVQLPPAGVDQQYTLHEAMLDAKPYAWIAPPDGDVMHGETITGTQIILVAGGKRYQANVAGFRFALPNLEGELVIKRGDQTVKQPTGPRTSGEVGEPKTK